MTTATEIIAFLRSRRTGPDAEGTPGLPSGWSLWLREAAQRHGRLNYALIDALIAQLSTSAARPLPPVVPMSRWRALRSLLWQHGEPPPREERGTRWAAGLGSLLLHLGFFALLILASLIHVPAPQQDTDGARVQLTLIGRGSQGEGGGAGAQTADTGAQAAVAPAARAPSPPPRASAAASPAPAEAAPPSPTPAPPTPQPQVAAPPAPAQAEPQPQPPQPTPAEQPLQVTQAPQPTQDFVLPPVTPPQVQLQAPPLQLPQASARVREIQTVQDQRPVAIQQVAPRPVDVPAPRPPEPQVRQREIAMPAQVPAVQAPRLREVPPAAIAAEPQLQPATPAQARVREIAMPPAPAAPAQTTTSATAGAASSVAATQAAAEAQASAAASASASPASSSNAQAEQGQAAQASSSSAASGAPPSPVAGGQSAGSLANVPGAGAKAGDRPGMPGPKAADDWGASNKAAPGTEAGAGQGLKGLFNADGSARLPDGLAGGSTVKPGVPGSRQQARIDADRAGTWLDRPALGYEPTMFDRYWIPGGSLLQDWVRAGLREMEIPIPGTGKRIRCVISVLQAGGACGLFDPNKNDQPATARPPPGIPVKRNPIPAGS